MANGDGPKWQAGSGVTFAIQSAVLILAMFGMWWSLADPRQEMKDIRTNYLTIREHNEFRDTVKTDLKRLEDQIAELRKQLANMRPSQSSP